MKILQCDRCGFELTEKMDINMAFDGMDAWQDAQRQRGQEPRGVFPCKYYCQCQGEMILVKVKGRKKKQKE